MSRVGSLAGTDSLIPPGCTARILGWYRWCRPATAVRSTGPQPPATDPASLRLALHEIRGTSAHRRLYPEGDLCKSRFGSFRGNEVKVARHFSAGFGSQKAVRPVGTLERVFQRRFSVVPTGLAPLFPPLPGTEVPGYFHDVPNGTFRRQGLLQRPPPGCGSLFWLVPGCRPAAGLDLWVQILQASGLRGKVRRDLHFGGAGSCPPERFS